MRWAGMQNSWGEKLIQNFSSKTNSNISSGDPGVDEKVIVKKWISKNRIRQAEDFFRMV
jgi:hypothetical protein